MRHLPAAAVVLAGLAFASLAPASAAPASSLRAQAVFRSAPLVTNPRVHIRPIVALHDFKGSDGRGPSSGLIADPSGNLYGETQYGGSKNAGGKLIGGPGTIYELSPPAAGHTTWTQTTIYTFGGTYFHPGGGLAIDAAGALYGESYDQSCPCETVFKLSPPAAGQSAWTLTPLHQLAGVNGNLAGPAGNVVLDPSGAIYGVTTYGGKSGGVCTTAGCGIAFKLTPPAGDNRAWSASTLYRFTGAGGDGAFPAGGLVIDASGSLYGTTALGGAAAGGGGTVFRLSPPAAGSSSWTETILHSFAAKGDPNGAYPNAGVSFGPGGALYGAAFAGGLNNPKNCNQGCGTVFELSPPPPGTSVWPISVLVAFTGYAGEAPLSGLTVDPRGPLYGLTDHTAFELTPPASGAGPWTQTVLHVFGPPTSGGKSAIGPLLEDSAGNLYGTANPSGFGSNDGSVFELLNTP